MPSGTTTCTAVTGPLVAGPGDVRLVQGDDEPVELPRGVAQRAGVDPVGEPVGDHLGQRLGGGVHPGEVGLVVEVAVGQLAEHGVQLLGRPADVDDDVVGVEVGAPERRVDDVRRPVQALRGSEHLTAEAVGDHHVVADGHAEHASTPRRR